MNQSLFTRIERSDQLSAQASYLCGWIVRPYWKPGEPPPEWHMSWVICEWDGEKFRWNQSGLQGEIAFHVLDVCYELPKPKSVIESGSLKLR